MGSRMDVMTRKLFCAFLILLLISGCAMTADPESETQETKTASTTLSEKQTDITKPATPAEFHWDQGNQSDPLANKTVNSANKIPSKDEIRLLQARMKAVGFDPGPIDGIMGVKTRSQLVAAHLVCSMLKTFPAILNQEPQLPEKRVPALVSPQKPAQPVTSPSTASVTAVNKNPSQQSISRKPWLAP